MPIRRVSITGGTREACLQAICRCKYPVAGAFIRRQSNGYLEAELYTQYETVCSQVSEKTTFFEVEREIPIPHEQ